MPRLLSVNVGLPRDVTWNGKAVRTAIWKSPAEGRQIVRKLNIVGDAQGDLAGHGGEQRAVFVYQMDSYRYWESFLGRKDLIYGQFGENFTVDGLLDSEVCIGDRYRIRDAIFEVTQPRVMCYRVGIRMNEPRMPALLVAHHRPGFYFRVLQEGEVGAGDDIVKISDGPEQISVAEVDALNRWRSPLPATRSYAVPSRPRVSRWIFERSERSSIMRSEIVPAGIFPDFELPDHTGKPQKLSELQGDDPLILTLARGHYCPKEHQQHLELAAFYPKIAVAYTQIVTIATDDHHTLQEFRASVGAQWTFLSDPGRTVQEALDIQEYTDPEHNPMIPHTLVLKPGLVIYNIYNGYWFWGRPSVIDLWHDLRALTSEIRPDWDLSAPGLREAWNAGDLSRFHGWNKPGAAKVPSPGQNE